MIRFSPNGELCTWKMQMKTLGGAGPLQVLANMFFRSDVKGCFSVVDL